MMEIHFSLISIFLCLSATIVEGNHEESAEQDESEEGDAIISNHGRSFRKITLGNELKVLLVSDPETDMSAASLIVPAGSMNGPANIPGLPHFCEHLLFLGNEKYPEPEELFKFVASNGGSNGAKTGVDYTEFHFIVLPNALNQTLDHLANMIKAPLFLESYIEKEVKAVQSEHDKDVPNDNDRFDRIVLFTSKPSHPFNRFTTGNEETLWIKPKEMGIDVRQELINYHHKFYSSNIMGLVVVGEEELDVLEEIVRGIFEQIPNRNAPFVEWNESPYGDEEMGRMIQMVPINDRSYVTLEFPIHRDVVGIMSGYYDEIFSHLGSGGLLSVLQSKGLALSVSAFSGHEFRHFNNYQISVGLTKLGVENYVDVVHTIFEYVAFLRIKGPQKWYWKEVQKVDALEKRFREKSSVLDLVTSISRDMAMGDSLDELIEGIMDDGSESEPFRKNKIDAALNYINPENMRIYVVSKIFQNATKLVEPYYPIDYNYEKIDISLIEKWKNATPNAAMKLPTKNYFIPKNFELKIGNESVIPRIINESRLSTIWYLKDSTYEIPKVYISVKIFSPSTYSTPLDEALNFILARMIKLHISNTITMAKNAGTTISVVSSNFGMKVVVHGFNDGIKRVLSKVMKTISGFTPDCDMNLFTTAKNYYRNYLQAEVDSEPCHRAKVGTILVQINWTIEDLLDVMDDVGLENLILFYNRFISRLKFEWLLYGNILPDEAMKLVSDSQNLFLTQGTKPILSSEYNIISRSVEIPKGTSWIYKMETRKHNQTCTKVTFQAGKDSSTKLENDIYIQLLEHFIDQPVYVQLRTNEQLGYMAHVEISHRNAEQTTLSIYVQGNREPSFVEIRIDQFLKDFYLQLKNMTEEEFDTKKQNRYHTLDSTPNNLGDYGELLWDEIDSGHYKFNRTDELLQILNSTTLEKFVDFYAKFTGMNPDSQRKLTIYVFPSTMMNNNMENATRFENVVEEIKDISKWKQRQKLVPNI